jgi:predicted RNase H-like nuclease (RuvC/YqgF family)
VGAMSLSETEKLQVELEAKNRLIEFLDKEVARLRRELWREAQEAERLRHYAARLEAVQNQR